MITARVYPLILRFCGISILQVITVSDHIPGTVPLLRILCTTKNKGLECISDIVPCGIPRSKSLRDGTFIVNLHAQFTHH